VAVKTGATDRNGLVDLLDKASELIDLS